MTTPNDSQSTQDFRRSIFGLYTGNEVWPQAFLSQLQQLAHGTDTTLGLRLDEKSRVAFWLKGRVLGHLACTGATDADAEIKGWVLRLDRTAQIDIEVKTAPGTWDTSPWDSGRILQLNGNALLDASPGVRYQDKRPKIEEFIDQVLAIFAGQTP